MKFCSSCGKEISETAAFCDGCGAKTGGETAVAVMEKNDSVVSKTVANKELSEIQEREQVLGQMYVCYDAILAIGVAHEELTKAEEELAENKILAFKLKTKIDRVKNDISRLPELKKELEITQKNNNFRKKLASLALFCILGGLPTGILIAWLANIEMEAGAGIAILIMFLGSSSIMTYIKQFEKKNPCEFKDIERFSVRIKGIESSAVDLEKNEENHTEAEKKVTELSKSIPILEKTLQSICEEESSRFMMEYLPKDYCNLDAVSSFITYLENKRADTFKEAINVYEDEMHKSKMEKMQQVSMDKLNTQSKMMAKSIEQQAQWQKENAARQERMIANSEKINEEIRFGNAVSVINLVDRWEQEGRLKK